MRDEAAQREAQMLSELQAAKAAVAAAAGDGTRLSEVLAAKEQELSNLQAALGKAQLCRAAL